MKIYNYGKQTGEYIGESTASENPLEQGKYLIPSNATTKEPIISKAGFVTVFKDGEWTSVEDIRGTWYNIREEVVIVSLDDDVSGLTKEPVPYTDEELEAMILAEKLAEAQALLDSTQFKFGDDYDQKDTPEWLALKVKRQEAREFIRVNDVPNP